MRDLRLAKFVEEQQVRRLALLREEERIRLEVVKLMRESAQGPPPPVKHGGGSGSPGGAPSAAATVAALAAADSISGGGSGGSGGGSGGGGGGSGGAGGDSAEISQLGGGDLYALHASHFGGGPGPATAGPAAARGTLGMVSTAPLGHGSTLMSLGGESVWASQEFADAAGSGLRSPGRERGPSANEEGFDDGGGDGGDGGGGDGAASSAFPSRSITRAGGSRTGASLRLAAGAGTDGGQSSSKLGSGSAAESGFGASPPGLRTGATSGSFAGASPGASGFEGGLSGAGSASGFEGAGRPVLMTAVSTLSGGSAFDGETRDLTTLLPPSAPASPRLPEEGAGMGASAGAGAGAGLGANASASAGVSAGASAVAADGGDGGAIDAELLDKLRAATSEAKARLPSTPTMHAKRGGGEGEAKTMDALELAPPHDSAAAPEPVAAASAAVAAGDAADAEETKAAE